MFDSIKVRLKNKMIVKIQEKLARTNLTAISTETIGTSVMDKPRTRAVTMSLNWQKFYVLTLKFYYFTGHCSCKASVHCAFVVHVSLGKSQLNERTCRSSPLDPDLRIKLKCIEKTLTRNFLGVFGVKLTNKKMR